MPEPPTRPETLPDAEPIEATGTEQTERLSRRRVEALIADGFHKVPCYECGKDLEVEDRQEGESGARGYRYACKSRSCDVHGFAHVPLRIVLLKLAQGRLFQMFATAIASFSIAGLIGLFQTGSDDLQPNSLAAINEAIEELEKATHRIETTTGGAEDVFPGVERDVLGATKSIDIISFGDLHTKATLPRTRKFLSALVSKANEAHVPMRRLIWRPEHLSAVDSWAKELGLEQALS